MTGWFQKHTGWATVVLAVAWLLGMGAVFAALSGHLLAAAAMALVTLGLWQPIQPTISAGFITGPRRR